MIKELLGIGEKNALTAQELATACRCSTREITKQIHRERLSGAPICSSGSGFYMPESLEEIRHTAAHLYARAREINKIAAALEDVARLNK